MKQKIFINTGKFERTWDYFNALLSIFIQLDVNLPGIEFLARVAEEDINGKLHKGHL
jgi:hypothetical protein